MTVVICQSDVLRLPLADKSVDLVFCSPPYEAARTYGIGFNLRGQEWVDWAVAGFVECVRVCRGLVAWVVEGQTRNYRWSATPILLAAELHRRGYHLRKPPIFHRVGIPGSGGRKSQHAHHGGGPDWLRNDYELIICGTSQKGKLPWADGTAMGHAPKWAPGGEMSHMLSDGTRKNQWGGSSKSTGGERGVGGHLRQASPRPSHLILTKAEKVAMGAKLHTKRDAGEQANGGSMREQAYLPPVFANPGNVIRCNVGGGQMGSKLAHKNEAPFPEKLAEFFIRSFCPPGGIVLDPFSGSGTTPKVAFNNGRRVIAFDIRMSQCELSQRRVTDAKDMAEFSADLKTLSIAPKVRKVSSHG